MAKTRVKRGQPAAMSQKNFSCSIRVVVRQDGLALDDVTVSLRTADFYLAWVKQTGWALKFVPRPLRAEVLAKIEQQTPGGEVV